MKKIVIFSFAFIFFILNLIVDVHAEAKEFEFKNLCEKLISDGFKKEEIINLYKQVNFIPQGTSLFITHNEAKLNYSQFLEEKSLNLAKNFLIQHKKTFLKSEAKYQVDKEVVAAIALVETRCGNFIGSRKIIESLSSIASLDDLIMRDNIWEQIKDTGELTRAKFDKKAKQKAKWAYKELVAFLKYTKREKLSPTELVGSYAGAMGIAQFIPSNALKLAQDGNQDNKTNLFDPEDAIFSIAYYLKQGGWEPNLSEKDQAKVVYTYNHSSYYVDAVLKIAKELKKIRI